MKIPKYKEKIITCGILASLVLLLYFLNIPCLFKVILHIPCPGCGMTRAYMCLLHLDFRGAFAYHPLFWSVPYLILYYLYDGNLFKSKWLDTTLITVISLAFIALWIYRIATGAIP